RDGRFLLLQWSEKATICAAADLSRFLFPPVPTHFGARSDFIGDGANFVVGLPKGGLAVRDSTTGALVHAETNSAAAPEYDGLPLAVSPDGRLIARRSRPALNLRDFSAAAYPDNQGLAAGASFSPDNSLLDSGGYDNRLELWSPADGKFLGEVGHHHTGVINVEFSPDGRFVASGEDGLVRIWRVRGQNLVRKINAGAPTRAVLSADGKYVAAAG